MKLLKKELVSVRIPTEMNKKLTAHVAAKGISKTAFILTLIDKELSKEKNNKSANLGAEVQNENYN